MKKKTVAVKATNRQVLVHRSLPHVQMKFFNLSEDYKKKLFIEKEKCDKVIQNVRFKN